MKKYFITAKKDTTLNKLLSANLKNTNTLQLIKNGGCWIDKKRLENPETPISAKTTVKVFINKKPTNTHILKTNEIIFEDENILAVFKPEKLNVQSDFASQNNNLTFSVFSYLKNKNINYNPVPFNRLDLNVSGLVLFAKNKKTEKDIFALSRDKKIYKQYTAFTENSDIEKYRICNKLLFFKNKARENKDGKIAKSLFIKASDYENSTRYNIFIFTGRRHQIRVHASDYLKPIIGDRKYKSKIKREKVYLYCTGLNFKINKKKYRLRLPEKFIEQP